MSTVMVCEQAKQRKKAIFMSGIMDVARITSPLTETSLSMSAYARVSANETTETGQMGGRYLQG